LATDLTTRLKILVVGFVRRRMELRDHRWMCDRGVANLLRKVPANAIPPDWCDLRFLYEQTLARKPRSVVEFGSGCSTVVIAQALVGNGRGHLYSIESDEHWAEVTASYLASEHRQVCSIHHCPIIEENGPRGAALRYTSVPKVEADFVYVDGPELSEAYPVSSDPLDMQLSANCFVVIDGRKPTFNFLRRNLGPEWSAHWNPFGGRGTLERSSPRC
jgi:hypothetical protein